MNWDRPFENWIFTAIVSLGGWKICYDEGGWFNLLLSVMFTILTVANLRDWLRERKARKLNQANEEHK